MMIEQAIFRRGESLGRSLGLTDEDISAAQELVRSYGRLPDTTDALFVHPLTRQFTIVAQVRGDWCRLLAVPIQMYRVIHDPFWIDREMPPNFTLHGELPTLSWNSGPPAVRTLEQVKDVLRDDDSPALLGAAQSLVDGGRLAFERDRPDRESIERLWQLLPDSDRGRISMATFAPSSSLLFQMMVTPRAPAGYLTDAQAGDYPEGRYELALQLAAETDDYAKILDLFARRSGSQALRLAFGLLIGAFGLGLALKFIPWEKLR